MNSPINEAIERFSAIGLGDPRRVQWNGREIPRQLGEAACLLHYVEQLEPSPSDPLLLAVHCQHLRRFAYPRDEFPKDREGYLTWRQRAARRSSEEAAAILRDLGFTETSVEQVVAIMLKRDRRHHPDVQTMEDALCLAFFRLDALDFGNRHALAEVTKILRRTWLKMSPRGRALALSEPYPEPLRQLLMQIAADDATVAD